MSKHNLVYSYFGDDRNGFENDYTFALSFIMSHHSFTSALGVWRGKTCLVTNQAGKELIVDRMELYFDEVTILEKSVFSKISAMRKYCMMAFIHVDMDTYLLKTFPIRTLRGQLFCDYIVRNNPIDVKAFERCVLILKENPLIEEIKRNKDSIWSIENGVVGQDGFGRWLEYLDFAEDLIGKHMGLIEATDNREQFKRLIENILPYYFFKDRGIDFEVVINRNKDTEFEMFHHQVTNFNFIRLFGSSKKNPFLIDAVEKFVRNYYHDSYMKVEYLKND